MHQTGLLVWLSVWSKELELRNRMREFRSYGSVGEAPGNRCFYPEGKSKIKKKDPNQVKLESKLNLVQAPEIIFSKNLSKYDLYIV